MAKGIMADLNDIVLIYVEDKPQAFARIEAIEPDIKRGWYHVHLLFLQIPLTMVTWILRDVYINGDPFTIGNPAMPMPSISRLMTALIHSNASGLNRSTMAAGKFVTVTR